MKKNLGKYALGLLKMILIWGFWFGFLVFLFICIFIILHTIDVLLL